MEMFGDRADILAKLGPQQWKPQVVGAQPGQQPGIADKSESTPQPQSQ